VPFDVFEEHGLGSQNSNAVCDGWPEVAGIVGAESFSCRRERLAGITSREEVHSARKLCPREGSQISPDRSRVKRPAFHSRKKKLDCAGFDLRISDRAQALDASAQSKVNASVSCAEGEMSDFS
jgi:hypothetical protein